jgi:GH15 family glucan-1,4-alpha-glucosidase
LPGVQDGTRAEAAPADTSTLGPPGSSPTPPTTTPTSLPRAIGDYAIIGNGRSAALIALDGSLEWLCWPRFDSPSWFAALLDPECGGRFVVQAHGPFASRRRYVGDTNVLETTFETSAGVLRLTDCMPVTSERQKRRVLWPHHEILRRVECVEGEVVLDVAYEPRPNYGSRQPRLRDRGRLGVYCHVGAELLALRSDVPLTLSPDRTGAHARVALRRGERRYLSLAFATGEPAVLPSLGADADARLAASLTWWENWANQCTYRGPYRAAVVRSALALKLLVYAPSGAIVAAPTTSLPEWLGGVRNWDYRYCWLRDASLTVQALHDLGYPTEALAFLSWLIHTTRITRPELRVLYDVYGDRPPDEFEVPHLAGFASSRPVRVGNAAAGQLQLDVYGEVIDAAYQLISRGERIDRTTAQMLADFGETVSRRWREPDAGIWEIRAGPRHHTYSKAMCWVALDRLLLLHEARLLRVPAERFAAQRAAIRQEIEARGFNTQLHSYVSVFDGTDVDASLLQLGRHGYIDPGDARMNGTRQLITERLGTHDLLYRYRASDGLPTGEHAFGITSFWAVTAAAQSGDVPGARTALEHLLRYGNDVGLYAEEIDEESGAAVGNFPQAFTHVGLIDAALAVEHGRREPPATPPASAQEAVGRPSTVDVRLA